MRTVCQYIIALNIVAALLINLYRDVNGREAKEPGGFGGVVGTLIALVIVIFIYYNAGAFSELMP